MVVIVRGSNDDADKMLTAGSKSYMYDAAGRTTAVTIGNDTTTLSYDYEGRLTQITYPNASTNTFTYNGLDTRVGKTDSGGTKTFKRNGVGVTAPVLSDGVSAFTPGISTRTSGATKFNHGDRLGTLGIETNSSQTVSSTKQYDAFGNLTSTSGSSTSPFGFAGGFGYQEDPDSSLKLLGHRYYDSSTGRFLTRDKIKDGRNWYVYCDGNPTKYIDDDGAKKKLIVIVGNLGGTYDLRDCSSGLLGQIYDTYGDDYDIIVRKANSIEDVNDCMVEADAVAMMGHGWPFGVRHGRSWRVQDNWAAIFVRRLLSGKGRLDFIRVYSCYCLLDDIDSLNLWFMITSSLFAYDCQCFFDTVCDDLNGSGGKWWSDPYSSAMPKTIGGGARLDPAVINRW